MATKRRQSARANAAWRRSDYRFAVVSMALLIFLLGASFFGWLLGDQNAAVASPPAATAPQPTSRS
jgi:hypothetical protein